MFKVESEGEVFCIKPMNCPDTMLFFKTRKHSYRDLPLRVSEGQILHRNELSGALNGLLRVRQFAQDDAHLFVTEEQIEKEITNVVGMIERIYALFDLKFRVKLSTRPADFMGEPALGVTTVPRVVPALERALNANNIPFIVNHGDGAFYGPKIDFDVIDALGRKWQCATIQLDFQLPRRFELTYTDRENTQKTPIVIHRAIFGSLERFIGILIEHVAGAFPTWLAPVQAVIMPISDEQVDYCHAVAARFRAKGLRVEVDDRNEKLGYKVREAELLKTPYMLVAGRREAEGNSFSVRNFSVGDRGAIGVDEIEAELLHKVANREFDVKLKTISWSHEEETETDESGY